MYSFPRGEEWDMIVLSWVLHDLEDANASKVLSECERVLATDGHLVIVEMLESNTSRGYRGLLSTEMYLSTSEGRERTLTNFSALLSSVGLSIRHVEDNVDWRSVIVATRHSIGDVMPRRTPARLEAALRNQDLFHCAQFGTQRSKHVRSDTDVAVILSHQDSFAQALRTLCDCIGAIADVELDVSFTPNFELRSLLPSTQKGELMHLLLYVDPWVFSVLESAPLKNAILASSRKPKRFPRPAPEIQTYFDLLQKVANSLVLLLNRSPDVRHIVETHAARVATYVSRWSPASRRLVMQSDTLDLEEAIDFYRKLAITL
jgi:hypothetical protein